MFFLYVKVRRGLLYLVIIKDWNVAMNERGWEDSLGVTLLPRVRLSAYTTQALATRPVSAPILNAVLSILLVL